ncbi:MAG: short-chain dehydrogenase [Planctomycetes bacterium]|jgi:NAD(P)-dependent dehydrogenase (short-subunit alcohol dehydrogenase family)|nr:short-chain dehydrogenase [Planctomycetota bacterium]MDP6410287.1 SDR family NAD(P)-dependent oxidoreductase [Planctomycetota bacterium]
MQLAIVTGTSRGIGAAVARELLERDWRVMGCARGPAAPGLGGERYHHRTLDLADTGAVKRWFEGGFPATSDIAAAERVGLVNNAAVLGTDLVEDLDLAATVRALTVNVAVPVWLAGLVLRHAPDCPVRVVDLSSGAATSAVPGWAAYCAGKAALHMAGTVLAEELAQAPALAGRDLRLVSYAPHVVATSMQEEIRATSPERFPCLEAFIDLEREGRLVGAEGPAREIADLLASDDLPPHSTRRFEP